MTIQDNSPELQSLAQEVRMVRISCDQDHPEFGVYHPNGHTKTVLVISAELVAAYTQSQIAKTLDGAIEEGPADYDDPAGTEWIVNDTNREWRTLLQQLKERYQ